MKRFLRVLSSVGALTALWLGMASPSQADPLIINLPDGQKSITGFDFQPGNLFVQGAIPLTIGTSFEAYFQANMSSVLGPGGLPVSLPGLNTNYQLTVVSRFTEVVTAIDGTFPTVTAHFALAPVQTNPFFEIWFHNGLLADYFNGTGFNTGTKILSGVIGAVNSSSFTIGDVTAPPVALISATNSGATGPGKAYWNGTTTVTGSGNSDVALATMLVNSVVLNPAFFPANQTVTDYELTPSARLPFINVDPSKFFSANPDGVAPATVSSANIKGGINGVTPPDQIFELQDHDAFNATPANFVPEPSTLVLSMSGLGLAGLVRAIRRRRQNKA
jgi:hypothetical protein